MEQRVRTTRHRRAVRQPGARCDNESLLAHPTYFLLINLHERSRLEGTVPTTLWARARAASRFCAASKVRARRPRCFSPLVGPQATDANRFGTSARSLSEQAGNEGRCTNARDPDWRPRT